VSWGFGRSWPGPEKTVERVQNGVGPWPTTVAWQPGRDEALSQVLHPGEAPLPQRSICRGAGHLAATFRRETPDFSTAWPQRGEDLSKPEMQVWNWTGREMAGA
jgi:hypothetical protein